MTHSASLTFSGVLRDFPLFSDLSEEDLGRLERSSSNVSISAGGILFEEGTPGDRFYLILEGELEVTRREGGQCVTLAVLGPGGFLSEMSLLEDRPRTASAKAIHDSVLMAIQPDAFRDLLARSPGASLTMLRTVMARLRSTESTLVEQGRLAGLGTLAAGLAHELNNPATALLRSSALLQESLADWGERCAELRTLPLAADEVARMRELEADFFSRESGERGNSERNLRESRLEGWLQEEGVDEPWSVAAQLADAGWDRESVEEWTERIPSGPREIILPWIAAGATVYGLVDEIRRGARAVSSIVEGVRSYSQMDRGPIQRVDVGEGVSNTLVILKRKLTEGVKVFVDIPSGLPTIEAHGGELNQVWTNLIDNALDAMAGEGTLRIRARPTEGGVLVEIEDSGPGIPPEVRPRIFDPFFTTKPEGRGTGLGLAITYGIVVERHRGRIRVDSRPGRTVFRVAFPSRLRNEVD